jgi:hypothetical protein
LQTFSRQISTKDDPDNNEIDVTLLGGDWPAVWIHFDHGEVDQISWGQNLARALVGDSRKLLTAAAFTPDSPLRLQLLGREDNSTPDVDSAPSSTVQTLTFVYAKEGLRLTRTEADIGGRHFSALKVILTNPARSR